MKRMIGWFLAITMAAPACAQQPPAPAAAPKAAEVPVTTAVTPDTPFPQVKGVVVVKEASGEPVEVGVDNRTSSRLYLSGDGKNLSIVTQPEDPASSQIRTLEGYLSAVGQYSHSNRDATTTAIAAVMQAAEILKPKGADAQISYFAKVLDKTENENVKRAIRLQLIDAYKRAGQTDKALDELKTIILGAPVSTR